MSDYTIDQIKNLPYTPHFLKKVDTQIIQNEPNLKNIENVMLDLNENRYNDGITNLILLSLTNFGNCFIFNYSVSKIKRFEQEIEWENKMVAAGDLVGENMENEPKEEENQVENDQEPGQENQDQETAQEMTDKISENRRISETPSEPTESYFCRCKVILNDNYFKSEANSKKLARQNVVDQILKFYNAKFRHKLGDKFHENLTSIDSNFYNRCLLENDKNYVDTDLTSNFLSNLIEFCEDSCKSRPDVEVQYSEVSIKKEKHAEDSNGAQVGNKSAVSGTQNVQSGWACIDQTAETMKDFQESIDQHDDLKKGLKFGIDVSVVPSKLLNFPEPNPINVRVSIKSDNIFMTATGESINQAANLAAMNILRKNYVKEYFEYLEYENSEIEVTDQIKIQTDEAGNASRYPSQYETTLVEFCDWSNISHPRYFQLENYPGLLKSEIEIHGYGDSENTAGMACFQKALEMFATNHNTVGDEGLPAEEMTSHVTDQPIVAEGETQPEPSAEFKAQQEVTESTEDDAAPATPVQDPNPETQPVESTPGPEGDNQSQDMEMD